MRMYAGFIDMWTATLRQADPGLTAAQLDATVRLVIALADGLGLQMLSHQDDAQTRRNTAEAGVMLAAHLRARYVDA